MLPQYAAVAGRMPAAQTTAIQRLRGNGSGYSASGGTTVIDNSQHDYNITTPVQVLDAATLARETAWRRRMAGSSS
jgi:hypothetical protein